MNHNSVVDFQVSRSQSLGTRSLWHRPLSSDQPWQPVAFPAKTLGRPVESISAIARLTNATTEFKTASGNLSNRTNNHATLSVRAPSAPDSAPLTHSSFHNSLPSCSVTDSGSIPASANHLRRFGVPAETVVPSWFQHQARYHAVSPIWGMVGTNRLLTGFSNRFAIET